MKKFLLIIAITLCSNLCVGQNFIGLAASEFESAASYKPAEANVLLCANYLFDNPAHIAELNRVSAIQYIMKWMTGTPDYTFDIGQKAMKLTKGNSKLLSLYMAAMSKIVLEQTDKKLSSAEIYEGAENILVNYCSESDNKMKPTRAIKKIIKRRKK